MKIIIKKYDWFLTILVTVLFWVFPVKAQTTIGEQKQPASFSILELSTEIVKGGLRLPQLSTTQRDLLGVGSNKTTAPGLLIYNTDIDCVEFWNGAGWISFCSSVPPSAPILAVNSNNQIFQFDEIAGQTITVTTNQSGWTASSSETWCTVSPASGSFTVTCSTNSGGAPRTATITVTAGSLTETVTVTQLPDSPSGPGTPPAGVIPYVGAFWRAEQIGERIIRIPVTGANIAPWMAVVTYLDPRWNAAGGDGVVLAAGGISDNGGALWDTNTDPALTDAEDYQVSGSATVSGNASADGNAILFRIGLQKKGSQSSVWDPSDTPTYTGTSYPARYAKVTIFYGTGMTSSMNLFLRQGEWADYLMHYNDEINSGGMNNPATPGNTTPSLGARPKAVRFSPRNLTDLANGAPAAVITTGSPEYNAGLSVNGGGFTEYPTQAGHFFRWNYNRQAFAPHTIASITGWTNTQYGIDALWDASHTETCPTNYRRPEDGANTAYNTTGYVAGSEMRQSLWWKPQIGNGAPADNRENSVWGYYADGFFDRREIGNGAGTNLAGTNTSVSTANSRIAHIGNLFFNPDPTSTHYNASVFFPAAGFRSNTDGSLGGAGNYGFYWSSSSFSAGNSWRLYVYSTNVSPYATYRTYGFSVRCVR